uniref:Uncharacterized protein n=1 Tax=Rhizophora mucronata TaxID=61149 RepID=A0A2P2PTW6_RHIMU
MACQSFHYMHYNSHNLKLTNLSGSIFLNFFNKHWYFGIGNLLLLIGFRTQKGI